MPIELKIPAVGESITEVQIAKWLKAEGDAVAKDEAVAVIDSEKTTFDLPSPQAGRMAKILHQEGATVSVGTVIAQLDSEGAAAPAAKAASAAKEAPRAAAPASSGPKAAAEAKPAAPEAAPPAGKAKTARKAKPEAKAAKPVAEPQAVAAPLEAGATSDMGAERKSATPAKVKQAEPPAEAEPPAPAEADAAPGEDAEAPAEADPSEPAEASPAPSEPTEAPAETEPAEPEAESAPEAKTTEAKPVVRKPDAPPSKSAAQAAPSADGEEEVVPMTMLRRTIARRLVEAQQTMAMLTTFNEVDMQAVQALRHEHQENFQQRHGIKLGLMSFFVKAAIDGLKQFPQLNAEVRGNDIVYRNHFDLGVAIATERGLVVPVLRRAERLSFAEIEQAIAGFAQRAQANELQPEDLEGGTFTITNGGVFGSLLSTPIINPPQSGILGLHTITDRPVARDGQVVIRPMMYVALSYDHRIVDGREAVLFLHRLKEVIESPARMLIEI